MRAWSAPFPRVPIGRKSRICTKTALPDRRTASFRTDPAVCEIAYS
ncbi:hypothetical protein UCMB321_4977 [Pseudomonas batumici]|uniref:Uncharacterized protein n=1 Tax=Pseudomonas batumici TaxID=226910 RepID=A0A0C2HVK0_9PSED|nr:hypothetical protein UCMB321_4977 [Pseudomonas batumici]